jgi:alkylation response protein AidB-like acyl-CoA dehydrogenase
VSALVDAILTDIAARATGRTRYEGQPPREDEALAEEIATLRAENARLRALLLRYRAETPLGHQPHMIAHEVDAALAPQEPGHG